MNDATPLECELWLYALARCFVRDPAPGVDVATPGTFATLDVGLHGVHVEVRRVATGEIVIA